MPRPSRFIPGKQTRHPMYRRLGRRQEGGLSGGEESLAPTGVRTPNHPARSESLYRLQNLPSIKPNISHIRNPKTSFEDTKLDSVAVTFL